MSTGRTIPAGVWLAILAVLMFVAVGFDAGATPDEPPPASTTAVAPPDCEPAACLARGGFSPPFTEPVIYASQAPEETGSPTNPLRPIPTDDRCLRDADGRPANCKPAGASVAVLADGRVLFFNALEGTEDVEFSIVTEAGAAIENDQTRVLRLDGAEARFTLPAPIDGGADAEASPLLPGGLLNTDADDPRANSGALFCADLEMLADGRVLAVGGTNYYFEPGISEPIPFGVSELEGLRNARIFDPATDRWRQTGSMRYGRWYPSTTTLADGRVFVASGVTKLLKPLYPDRPQASGRNVVETETYDPACGRWQDNGAAASRSLPLYPRLHLLPQGQVLYNGGGQSFNPAGQAYDQALWNIVASYDPVTARWSDLGYAGLPLQLNATAIERIVAAFPAADALTVRALRTSLQSRIGQTVADPAALLQPLVAALGASEASLEAQVLAAVGAGFRGSTFSIQLPLRPDDDGVYRRAELLTAGGVLGGVVAPSPGLHVATDLSRIDRYDWRDGQLQATSRLTGALSAPRWYGTGVLLPTGEVMVFSGADRDEVQFPGGATPRLVAELFDPLTETWRRMATQHRARTYHNTAALLPDGRVLIGGHAPINTAYLFSITLPGFSPNDGRDPSFEIYSPPYAFKPRPRIGAAPARVAHADSFTIATPQAATVDSVVLVRRTSITHLVDGDQRAVVLPIEERTPGALRVRVPAQAGVLPPGAYMLFIVERRADGRVPSVSMPLQVDGAAATCAA